MATCDGNYNWCLISCFGLVLCHRFLRAGGANTKAANRPPKNFYAHFASLHAAEQQQHSRNLKESRGQTARALAPAFDYLPPTSKRRDGLRWNVRLAMHATQDC